MSPTGERLFLLDGTALAYRAHFAFLRANLRDSQGRPTGAVYGFVTTLLKLLREEEPNHVGVAFDPPGPTFRHKLYPEYKATREKMDDDLRAQMPVLREVVRAFDIPVLEVPGFEADDVLATVARQSAEKGIDAYIVTGDKDLCQCVNERVRIYNILKAGEDTIILDEAAVEEDWGVPPNRIADVLALMGDSSDNVPGVPSIGKKTAVKLLAAIGSLDDVLDAAQADDKTKIKSDKLRQKLREHRDLAKLSHELVIIDAQVPLDVSFDDLKMGDRDDAKVQELFRSLNFTRLLTQVADKGSRDEVHDYRIVRTDEELTQMIEALRGAPLVAFDTETTGLDPLQVDLVGLSFSIEEKTGWYVPLNLDDSLFQVNDGLGEQATRFLALLEPWLTDPTAGKCGQNVKYDWLAVRAAGIEVRGFTLDTMIASFCLDPEARQHNLDALALRWFGYRKIPTKEIIGRGKKQVTMAQVPVETVGEYACEDADFSFRLAKIFRPRLDEESVGALYRDVEMPLVPVLVDMEWAGVRIDTEALAAMSVSLEERTGILEKEIWELAGEPFNVKSPMQLGVVLFEKLGIQGRRKVRKTKKTGKYATDERTLRSFADSEIVGKLLEYRQLTKLRSTYTEALPKLVNPKTGRVHTSYSQVGAITGRLASSDPNLQNIPIRTEQGRAVRRAFIPREEGWVLLSADYSQIELRILAHMSGDEHLTKAFEAGADIHTETAARVFGIAPALVVPEVRSRAKAINFGIMYGMGATRLAEETGMTRVEATRFIEDYFRAYPAVKAYLDGQRAQARETGEVTTVLGRRRSLKAMYESSDPRTVAAADNVAVNTPIQGTAADIVKLAMIRMHRELRERGLKSLMIMQVHDELVFDVAPGELDAVKVLVREVMESAYPMNVPLVVDMGWGKDWLEAH